MTKLDFYMIQEVLDIKIFEKHPEIVGKDLTKEKILALFAETGEMMNELPEHFKFWSFKRNNMKRALEEYIDLFHFILTLGLDLGVDYYDFENVYKNGRGMFDEMKEEPVKIKFERFFKFLTDFDKDDIETYFKITLGFLAIGRALDFSWWEVEKQYKIKNEINHIRQRENY